MRKQHEGNKKAAGPIPNGSFAFGRRIDFISYSNTTITQRCDRYRMSEPIRPKFDEVGAEEEPLARLTVDYGFCPTCSEVASWRPIEAHLEEFSDVVSIQMRCNRCQEVGTVELTRKVSAE